ncbi:PIG-L family deacetylase [Streptomyces avermitilis]|uniref:PIG-L family deacetylase n=1 Tax=Streptomyces avermitilis TaxID=33903 RepID=UPI0033B83966
MRFRAAPSDPIRGTTDPVRGTTDDPVRVTSGPISGTTDPVRRTTRRAVLLGGAVAAVAAAVGCGPSRSLGAATATPSPASGKPAAQGRHALLMQVLAHPDDDLYFMNPDTQYAVSAGVPLVCVYVTAGEADGVNKIPGQPHPPADKAAYSSARHQGLRQSYAAQLGLPLFTPWSESVAALPGGHLAEVNSLENKGRRIDLVHLNLAMHTPFGHMGVPALWRERGLALGTVVADGSPLSTVQSYDHDGLLDVLVGLFERYRPTLVHTLDPDPDIQHSDPVTRIHDSEQPGYSDHADHTAVASFTWAAMVRWARTSAGGPPPFAAVAFRGYYNHHWPDNLPPAVLRPKAAHLVPYGAAPHWKCGNPAGCGDYNVGGERPLRNRKGWVRSTHYRYPGPRLALAEEADGRLTAYGVLGMRAVRWRETPEGAFGDPVDLGGGPLAPVLGAAALDDGRQLLFGLRLAAVEGRGGPDIREIVLLEQASRGGGFRAWTGLGNPEGDDDRGRRIGTPVAVTGRDGRVHLFVRNAEHGVSTRVRGRDGRWSPWRDLGGGPIQDGLTAVVGTDGEVRVYAPGRDTVHQWTPDGPVATGASGTGPLPAPADAIAVSGDRLYYRPPASTSLIATDGPAVVFPGYGPVSAAGSYLLGRGVDGALRLLHDGRATRAVPAQTTLDGPALRLTRRGPAAAGLSPDARPWLWRARRSGTGTGAGSSVQKV